MGLIIEIRKIPPGGVRLSGTLSPDELDLVFEGATLAGGLAYDLGVEVVSGELIVRGRLRMAAELTCSRCLRIFGTEIRVDRFSFSRHVKELEIIDLTENLRGDIIIALPIKPLCAQRCRGICAHCGNDLNLERCSCAPGSGDARWSALEELKLPPENKK
ncbi:MAG: DUF177 domain-containing protein [Candidatus Aureabacteria bacterium]|nr:DUF177 domain-containing protein [Candidatus Auribacterota bacterium]